MTGDENSVTRRSLHKALINPKSGLEAGRDVLLWYDMTETRQELLQMLLDDQSEKFVQCIASHVMILAQFIPVLNDILLTKQP